VKNNRRKALIAAALAAPLALAAAGCGTLRAFSRDTPITIGDGSLKIESAVPWGQFASEGNRGRVHPERGKSLTSVEVRLAGDRNSTIRYNKQRCEVTVVYADTDIVFTTNPTGHNLKINSDWGRFRPGNRDTLLEHVNDSSKISRVVVKRDGTTVVDERPNGGTTVVLHYEE